MKPGYTTTEFWGTITLVISNLIGMLVVVGMVDSSDQQSVTGHITGIVAAIEAFLVNGAVLWRYIQSREKMKDGEKDKEIIALKAEVNIARESERAQSRALAAVTTGTSDPVGPAGEQGEPGVPGPPDPPRPDSPREVR